MRPGGMAAELGVAGGVFSELLLRNERLGFLYSIDAYDHKGHGVGQYLQAAARLAPYRNRNTLLRVRFADALPLFPDGFFDLVYFDGFAHKGQENGRTIREWWP